MKKMKRIVTLLLAVVMMMAMSMTAFATEQPAAAATTGHKITVTNLPADETGELNVYKLADAGHNGKWEFASWVTEQMYSINDETHEYKFDTAALKAAVPAKAEKTVKFDKKTSVDVTELTGAAYLILASSSKKVGNETFATAYNPMIVPLYDYNNGTYVGKDAEVVAKKTGNPVNKEADDKDVYAGQTVRFTITSEVPFVENPNAADAKFVIYDRPQNLLNPTLVSAKVGGEDIENATLTPPAEGSDVYSIDLTSLLKNNALQTKNIEIVITAVVGEGDDYKNSAYSNFTDEDKNPGGKVEGFTGDITISKVDEIDNALTGAKFAVIKDNARLTFKALDSLQDGTTVYVYDANSELNQVEVGTNGKVKVTGLEEGTYSFEETAAPEGYSIKAITDTRTIDDEKTAHQSLTLKVNDTKLVSLPFTGGMGTTIFTVLGVAIMVLAAALYFVAKRKSAN